MCANQLHVLAIYSHHEAEQKKVELENNAIKL
jgi:hypothetical protein